MVSENKIILIDLPTFPKGTISLSLYVVSSYFKDVGDIEIFDLNINNEEELVNKLQKQFYLFTGLKVSAQNFNIAIKLSETIRSISSKTIIVWGGEFPSLMPELCMNHADVVVSGLFESVADEFKSDLLNNRTKRLYKGNNKLIHPQPRTISPFPEIKLNSYNLFMGIPLETTRGCTEVCTFCMVHTMQAKSYHTKSLDEIKNNVTAIGRNFINIIDYNFGVDKNHIINVCEIIKNSDAIGFMAEMCIEFLDDDEILLALSSARCKIIYCGLETIEEEALKSVHKMNTNSISNYARIIKKAQLHGIQIASGFILGMPNSTLSTFKNALQFFNENKIIYVKLTFLTYNPGTKAHAYYGKKGNFITTDFSQFDGNHLTYLPNGVEKEEVYYGTKYFIKNFYSIKAVLRRSVSTRNSWKEVLANFLFTYCYSHPYHSWLKHNTFENESNFQKLLISKYQKPLLLKISEKILLRIWQTGM